MEANSVAAEKAGGQEFDNLCALLPTLEPNIVKDALSLFESLRQRASIDDFNVCFFSPFCLPFIELAINCSELFKMHRFSAPYTLARLP